MTSNGKRSPRVIVLTTFDLDEYVYDALGAGASGFLLKDVTADTLFDAVRVVAAGDALLAPGVTRRLVSEFARLRPTLPTRPDALSELTPRETEVLRLVAEGRARATAAPRAPRSPSRRRRSSGAAARRGGSNSGSRVSASPMSVIDDRMLDRFAVGKEDRSRRVVLVDRREVVREQLPAVVATECPLGFGRSVASAQLAQMVEVVRNHDEVTSGRSTRASSPSPRSTSGTWYSIQARQRGQDASGKGRSCTSPRCASTPRPRASSTMRGEMSTTATTDAPSSMLMRSSSPGPQPTSSTAVGWSPAIVCNRSSGASGPSARRYSATAKVPPRTPAYELRIVERHSSMTRPGRRFPPTCRRARH